MEEISQGFFPHFLCFLVLHKTAIAAAAVGTVSAMGANTYVKLGGQGIIMSDQESCVPKGCGELPLLFFSLFPLAAQSQTWVQLWEVDRTA